MINLKRTHSTDTDFQDLVLALDLDLARRNGESNDFFTQYNKTDMIKNAVVAYIGNKAVACGAIKEFDAETMEVKRMFVRTENRGNGIAIAVLRELELWAKELEYRRLILETGDQMPEAIGLYQKCRYARIPNYGPYVNIKSSLCFEKVFIW